MQTTLNTKEHETALLLANAGELTSVIVKQIAGNDISTAVNGSPLTRDTIQNLLYRKIVDKVSRPSV